MKIFRSKMTYLTASVVLLALLVPVYAFATAAPKEKQDQLTFSNTMRKLWEDHITWTRLFIVSDVANLPDLPFTTQRLLQNQTDIGNAIKPFYGDQAGGQLTALLRDHILIAADLVNDAKAGNTTAFNADKTRWYDNANQIAVFLHNANPKNWPLEDMQEMMKSHLDLTLAEASDHLSGNYTVDIQDYDRVHTEILKMADMLTNGIIKQFPQMFK